jgi:hypothetical protein
MSHEQPLENDPRVEMECTITFRYKTDPSNYELSGLASNMLKEIAAADQELFMDDRNALADIMDSEDITVVVKPVTNH